MKINLGHNGVTETVIQEEDGVLHSQDVMHAQQVQSILDHNQRLRNGGFNSRAQMRPVASVPVTELHNWQQEWRQKYADKWTWQTFLAVKIRDRDYSKFRTSDIRL